MGGAYCFTLCLFMQFIALFLCSFKHSYHWLLIGHAMTSNEFELLTNYYGTPEDIEKRDSQSSIRGRLRK